MKFSFRRIYLFVLFYGISVIILAISCQSQSDYAVAISEKLFRVDHENADQPAQKEKQQRWKQGFAYVTKVIDGDTFWVDNGTDVFKVRFIGIDAPEIRNSRWKKKGYYAEEAKLYVIQLTENKWVRLEMDVQAKDRYQRILAYIYLEDRIFLNADLVANGYAVVDTYPPNVKYVDLFVDLQKQAREAELGLWGELPE